MSSQYDIWVRYCGLKVDSECDKAEYEQTKDRSKLRAMVDKEDKIYNLDPFGELRGKMINSFTEDDFDNYEEGLEKLKERGIWLKVYAKEKRENSISKSAMDCIISNLPLHNRDFVSDVCYESGNELPAFHILNFEDKEDNTVNLVKIKPEVYELLLDRLEYHREEKGFGLDNKKKIGLKM